MNAMEFVHEHLGKLLIHHAPPHPKPGKDSTWARTEVSSCAACGREGPGWYKPGVPDSERVCEICYTVFHQTPLFCNGKVEDLGRKGKRPGALREGSTGSLVVVTPEETRIYVTTKNNTSVNLALRNTLRDHYLPQYPAIERIRFRPHARRFLDLGRTKPPYVAFQSQGRGAALRLAATLAAGRPCETEGVASWVDGSGVWMTIASRTLEETVRLADAVPAVQRKRILREWTKHADGENPANPKNEDDKKYMMLLRREQGIGEDSTKQPEFALDAARRDHPSLSLVLCGALTRSTFNIMTRIFEEGTGQ